jgi:cardiolipin synthase
VYLLIDWVGSQKMEHGLLDRMIEADFTGGVGIADNWSGDATSPDHWRDSHYRLQGPAVAQMQAAFMDNWIKPTGTVLHGKE